TMWSGSVVSIPSGWLLCDGTNGTPDLRDRFIVGAGGAYTVNDTGGADSVQLSGSEMPSHSHGSGSLQTDYAGSHSHGGTAETAGSHSHGVSTANLTGNMTWPRGDGEGHPQATSTSGILSTSNINVTTMYAKFNRSSFSATNSMQVDATHSHSLNNAGNHTHNLDIQNAGSHDHDVDGNTSSSGGNAAHENRPPYLALAYIMKA
ncbi:MAG: hypothetical protein RI554_11670, partial [Trueperaceae bacterium]|nr:hypothetical protein [Trueperaceae bacterium]